MLPRLRASLALPVFVALGMACGKTAELRFELTVPPDVRGETAWFEIGAFERVTCSALGPMLGGGIPDGAAARIAFESTVKAAPKLGDIGAGRHAFGVVAKNASCAVVAAGCAEAEAGKDATVRVSLRATPEVLGACGSGAVCQSGRCIPANRNEDPSVGAGCSLELLGAGPLAESLAGSQTIVSAPAIAATAGGFVIVYREVDPGAETARLMIQTIDPAGGALVPAPIPLPGRCSTSEEKDGIGLLINGADGLVTSARAACASDATLEVIPFRLVKDTPQARGGILPGLASAAGLPLLLSDARPAARRGAGGVAVFLQGDEAIAATIDPTQGIVTPSGTFGGVAPMTGAWVATSDRMLALLAAGTGPVGPAPPVTAQDGGTDAGAPPPPDEPPSGSLLRLLMLPATQSLDALDGPQGLPRRPLSFPGRWGSIAVVGERAIVLSDSSEEGVGQGARYRAFDANRDTVAGEGGVASEGPGEPVTGDVAIQGDRAFFVVLKPGAITLSAFSGASLQLEETRVVNFASETRIPTLSGVRDGRVALAATDSGRVAVVWTTATRLGADDATGGYAVFACTP